MKMAMMRFVGLGFFAVGSLMMFGLAACSSSSSDDGGTGGGGGYVPTGGGGGLTGLGGGGGLTNMGGGTGTATCGSNLLAGDLGTTGNWVGGDAADTSDNPCGIQGAFYAYGDGSSCTLPPDNNPCSAGKCCINGATVVDSTYAAWGCGMGLSLNDSGGNPSVKSPYAPGVDGTVTGFRIKLEGTSPAEVRISYTQVADTTGVVSPFANGSTGTSNITVPGTYDVLFTDVSCPTWGTTQGCTAGGPNPYDVQVGVAGGNVAGDFNVCITELTPLM